MWDEQIDAVAPHSQVIVPDFAGFGRTPPPPDPRAARIEHYADLVAGLIEQLGIAPVAVCGLSMGGYVTLALWRRHPELVAAVVLADTRATADTDEVAARRVAQQAQVEERGTAELIETMLQSLLSEETREHHPDVVARARALMHDATTAGIVAALEAMRCRPDSTDLLASIDVPALVLVGEHDGMSPPSVAEAMADALPEAELEVIPGAGHLSNLESPEAFNRALETFVTRL